MANSRRSERGKRPTAKVILNQQDAAEEAEVQAEAERRRADKAKRNQRQRDRAAGIALESIPEEERQDSTFTSRAVVSRPTSVKQLAQRKGKVPTPPHPEPTPRGRSRTHTPLHGDLESDGLSKSDGLSSGSPSSKQSPSTQPRSFSVRPFPPSQPRRRSSSQPSAGALLLPQLRVPTQTESRSPSPVTGNKRARSPDDDSFNDLFVKAPRTTGGRPKASDYDEVEQEIIALANRLYRCILSAQDGFPDTANDITLVKKAWRDTFKIKALNPIPLTPSIFRIIRSRSSQLRGEAKTKIALLVGPIYGFRSGHSKKTIIANRNLAESLKHQKAFVYEVLGDGTTPNRGLYRNPIIQDAINILWFRNKRDEGIEFSSMFDPVPVEAIAFVLTAVEAAIDEWLTGIKVDIPFKADDYRQTYRAHFRSLRDYGVYMHQHNLLDKMCQRLYDNGRDHAGVPPQEIVCLPVIPQSAFEAALQEYEAEGGSDNEEVAVNNN